MAKQRVIPSHYHDVSRYEKCSRCPRVAAVAKHDERGRAICHNCTSKARYRDYSKWEYCSKCSRFRPVAQRTKPDRQPVCDYCNRRKVRICWHCDREKVIHARGLCYYGYKLYRQGKLEVRRPDA